MTVTRQHLHTLVDRLNDEAALDLAERFVAGLLAQQSGQGPTAEDALWLGTDLSGLGSFDPYDWGDTGEPKGRVVRYAPSEGLIVE